MTEHFRFRVTRCNAGYSVVVGSNKFTNSTKQMLFKDLRKEFLFENIYNRKRYIVCTHVSK